VAIQETGPESRSGATFDAAGAHCDRHGALVIFAEVVDALRATADAIIARGGSAPLLGPPCPCDGTVN